MHIPQALRWTLLLAIGISAFALFWVTLRVNADEVRDLARSVGLTTLAIAILFDILNIISYGSAWYFLVHTVHPTARIRKCVQGVMISIFGDILVPTASVTGEALRVAFANREFSLSYPQGIATTVVHRVLNLFAFVGIFGVSSIILLLQGGLNQGLRIDVLALLILAIIPGILGVSLVLRPNIVNSLLQRFIHATASHPRIERFFSRLLGGTESFEKAISIMRTKRGILLVAYIFLILQWLFQILIPYAFLVGVSQAFHMSVNYWTYFWLVALAFPLYGLVNLMPIGIPAMAGILDSAMASTFIVLGFIPEVAITTTLLTRFVIVLFESTLTGAVTLLSGYQGFVRNRKSIVQA